MSIVTVTALLVLAHSGQTTTSGTSPATSIGSSDAGGVPGRQRTTSILPVAELGSSMSPLAGADDQSLSLFQNTWPIVEASVGDEPLRLLIDSGTNHTLIDVGKARLKGWRLSKCQTVAGSMLGEICRVDLPPITISTRHLPAMPGLAADMVHSELGEALEVDGLLGSDLLSQSVLTLDFPHARWSLMEPNRFHPPAGVEPIPIEIDDFVVSVPVLVDGHATRFILDTGNSGPPILLHVPGQEQIASPKGRRTPNGIRSGAGGSADSVSGRARFQIGATQWQGVSVLVAEHPSNAGSVMAHRQGILGLQFLRCFRLTIDYPRQQLFLEQELPLATAPPPTFGLIARPHGGRLIVDALTRTGAAERAGLRVGDEIVAVEDVKVSRLNLAVIARALRPVAPGEAMRLTIQSGTAAPRSVRLAADSEP
ncbi:MAG: aspartyl protease family protein [Deltaproteobacteria bacterium]